MINLCDVLQSPESVRDMKQQHSQRTYRNVFNVNVKDVPIKKEFKLPNQHIHRNILTSMHSIEGGLATVDATRKGDNVGAQGGAHVRDSGLLPVLALAIAKEKGQGTWSSCLVDRPPLTVTRAFSALITSMSPSSSSSGCARSFVTSGWSSFLPSKLYRPMHPIASHLVADIHGPSGSQMLLTVRSETKNIRGTYLRHPQRLLLWLFFSRESFFDFWKVLVRYILTELVSLTDLKFRQILKRGITRYRVLGPLLWINEFCHFLYIFIQSSTTEDKSMFIKWGTRNK